MPNALVTGSPDRVPDIAIALKSAGFDILSAGAISAEDVPDLEANSVDCYVQLPFDPPAAGGGALRRTRDALSHEMVSRFDAAAEFLPLLAPSATVLLVTEGSDGFARRFRSAPTRKRSGRSSASSPTRSCGTADGQVCGRPSSPRTGLPMR